MACVLALALLLTSCGEITKDDCKTELPSGYSGIAIAMETGAATFAISDHCAFMVSGSNEVYDRIFEAWRASPYEGDLRPIYISASGSVIPNEVRDWMPEDAKLTPYFVVSELRETSTDFTRDQADFAFRMRLGRPAPPPRSGDGGDDPETRLILTD